MKERKTRNKKASSLRLGLISALIIGTLLYALVVPYTPTIENKPSWHVVWSGPLTALAEGVLTGDASGILEVFFINNTATPNSSYSINVSNTLQDWCNASHLGYASADNFYTELAHSVNFDIVVRLKCNQTISANSTGIYAVFNSGRVRCNITMVLNPTSLTPLIKVETYNATGSAFMYVNCWINWTTAAYTPAATGFQIAPDSSNAINEIRFEAYY